MLCAGQGRGIQGKCPHSPIAPASQLLATYRPTGSGSERVPAFIKLPWRACGCVRRVHTLQVVCHMMPDLPNVGWERDLECFREFFENPDFRADGLKLYPVLVIRGAHPTPPSPTPCALLTAQLPPQASPHWMREVAQHACSGSGRRRTAGAGAGPLVPYRRKGIQTQGVVVCVGADAQALVCTSCGKRACTATTRPTSWWTWWRACWRWCRPGCASTASRWVHERPGCSHPPPHPSTRTHSTPCCSGGRGAGVARTPPRAAVCSCWER